MQFNQYLFLPGNCEEAFRTYQRILGGRLVNLMRLSDLPPDVPGPPGAPADWQSKIMHVCLEIDGRKLMGSDVPPDHAKPLGGFSVQIGASSSAEAERVFSALSEGGQVNMPLQQTFWSNAFGMLVDRFGVPWMIDYTDSAQAAA